MEKLHIGAMVADRLREAGMSKAEFARRIHTSRQNINTLLNKESLDLKTLLRIGEVLRFDFLKEVSGRFPVVEEEVLSSKQVFVLVEVSREERDRLLGRG